MYPNLYYAFKDLFGLKLDFLRFVNSFGFFVAIAFLCAAYTLSLELKRKESQGLLQPEYQTIVVGKPASFSTLLINFILGFILGFKLIGLFFSGGAVENSQEFIMSSKGSWPAGLLLGAVFAGINWWEKNKQKLAKPEERKIRIWPHDRVGDLTIFAAVFGFIGAKIFNSLETWSDFVKDPIASLFGFSGLTFYGGLICAALAIWYYAKKHNIGFWNLNDAAAPGLMLAYGVGRIGCQVAGDGDWGIVNSAYFSMPNGKVVLSNIPNQFDLTLKVDSNFYIGEFGGLDKVQHLSAKAPSFLPDWLFAYSYPHNVNNVGIHLADCTDKYCNYLPLPVFPTPFYEVVTCILLFALIWSFRKKFKVPGQLFGFYLLLNGIERFFVEKIRVNTKYDIFGFHPTQAELISFALIITGIILLVRLKKTPPASEPSSV